MRFFKKSAMALTGVFMMLGSVTPVHADTESEFWKALNEKGIVENDTYKVERIRDNVYHMDEGTSALPGGATKDGVMNNPSSIYFVVDGDEVLMIDLGNPVTAGTPAAKDAKEVIDEFAKGKNLTIALTHSHPDHVGLGMTPELFADTTVQKIYVSEADEAAAKEQLPDVMDAKIEIINEGNADDAFTFADQTYSTYVVPAHTPGSIMIQDKTHNSLFTGDTFGSGAIWLFWNVENNPIGALEKGVARAQGLLQEMKTAGTPSVLCGHRWQQFWDANPQRPEEITIQYFNDMAQVIKGLTDGTTVSNPYTVMENGIELSANGAKAKIDTTQAFVDKYLEGVNSVENAYVYSASNLLGIDTVNNTAAATFIIYPDGYMSDEEAQKYLDDTGLTDYAKLHASKVYVAKPENGEKFTEDDMKGFQTIMSKVVVTANLKLVGIGNGATFINENLSKYMNAVSGVALLGGEGDEVKLNASVPAYIGGDVDYAQSYIDANSATEKTVNGTATTYLNPESEFEMVVTDTAVTDPVEGFKAAYQAVLRRAGRIGNYLEETGVGTWYTRPIITGKDDVDTTRKYQYYHSVDAIEGVERTVYTEDLDGDGVKSLWYVYVPESVKDETGTVPVVFLMHGNTNDPRTQYETSGWAKVAADEGIILVCPEWQGHTYQGYSYDPMTADTNFTADSDFITGCYRRVMEEYPQIDTSRVYISGLSAGCRNTTNNGLVNTEYFAAGAGQSGPFKNNETGLSALKAGVAENKDDYDFPIIYFAGDRDEYLPDWDQLGSSGGLEMAQLYAELNEMAIPDGNDETNKDLYGVNWDETYTITPTADSIATIKGGILTSEKGVEICMNRIYGWGHWNYAPDAELMWDFMKKYARDTETGEIIRLDQPQQETLKGTNTVVVDGEDWGPAVTKTIVKLDREVASVSIDGVIETKEVSVWAPPFPHDIASSQRTVLKYYLCDKDGNEVNTASSYVAVEMAVSPSEGSPFIYDVPSGKNSWCTPYILDVIGTAKTADGTEYVLDTAEKIDLTKADHRIVPDVDGIWNVDNEYKGITYGEYRPDTGVDAKKPLIIWLHGAGEGGDDNYIDLLGNEVTALSSAEFQKLFKAGAYVITPQCDTMWMDGGDGQYQNGDKGSMYADDLFELIDQYVKEHKDIDPERVIIGGCSNGGYMTMEMILKHPDYFYKAYPICEAYYDEYITDEQIAALKKGGIEIWFTYAENDTTVDPTLTSIPTAERMKKAGITVHMSVWADVHDTTGRFTNADGTPYQYAGHWSWIYFDNNENYCTSCTDSLNEWKWMAAYETDTDTPADTSDPTDLMLWGGIAMLAAGAAVTAMAFRRREN